MAVLFCFALVPLALRAATSAVTVPQDLVQPWTYRSPSAALELFVDPSEPFGLGPASYCMKRGTDLIWTRTLSFTLADVLVNEDGTVGGFGYARGKYPGELVVAVLDPDGSERWVRREQREIAKPCSAPDPTVREM